MNLILLVIVLLLIVGALPTWPYSSGWGYYPSGGLTLLLLVLIILALTRATPYSNSKSAVFWRSAGRADVCSQLNWSLHSKWNRPWSVTAASSV
jgi:Protein of unknown function (DUF3309)